MGRTGKILFARRAAAALLGGTILAGLPMSVSAQEVGQTVAAVPAVTEDASAPAPLSVTQKILSLVVIGSQRLEPQTILSYIHLRPGDVYTQVGADQALKDLYATELFSNVNIRHTDGEVTIEVQENPVVNRIILEGNKRLKSDKLYPEIKLLPRQIFTRSKVRADVARILELYKRQGRFAATVEPKSVELPQNRVDIVFEISEGPKSKVRRINILGNEEFSDGELRSQMVTKQARITRIFSSSTSYDPDRLAFDQQKLRQYYLTEGYADFRVVSAVAELTPDKRDFIITYVVEEGERYHFGDVEVDSQIRDLDSERLASSLRFEAGDWYDAKLVEDTVEWLTESAGTFGYAFADVSPVFNRDRESLTMNVKFVLNEAPRVYVEKININGNTLTQDKVARREFRIAEGDAFNSLAIQRSTSRINSLGYFQENFEMAQRQGSAPDRIILDANVQEQATGELQLSAGFSSLESFILQASIRQRNFRGRGQTVGASVNYSRYSRAFSLNFTEPYVFNKNISAGLDIYRRDTNNFNAFNRDRNLFEQTTTGFQLRAGVPLTEYMSFIGRYTLNFDNITIDENQYFSRRADPDVFECDPLLAGRYLCEAIGKRASSILGASLVYNTLDSRVRPTRGINVVLNADFAGLGGSVKYAKFRANATKYFPLGGGWIFSIAGEGGIIKSLENRGEDVESVRLTDRFFLGDPQMRGFDIRGVGPRIIREFYGRDEDDNIIFISDPDNPIDDPLGGNIYYLGKLELEIPLGTGAREMGLRPSIFLDAGAVFNIHAPNLIDTGEFLCTGQCGADNNPLYLDVNDPDDPDDDEIVSTPTDTPLGQISSGFREIFLGNTPKPRLAVGVGVNWNSPFGPFRLDFAHVLLKQKGDDTKSFSFNVGTQF